MTDFFVEGGWGMWPILIYGLVMMGAAARYALAPAPGRLRFIVAMGVTTLIATVHATWIDFGAVCHTLASDDQITDAMLTRTLLQGLMESTRPGALGAAMLTLTAMLASIGVLREGRAAPVPG